MLRLFLWIPALGALSQLASAQIMCSGPVTQTESAICAISELMQLDRMLGASYKAALRVAPDQRTLKTEQRGWIARRNECDRYDCLEPQYRSRITELQSAQVRVLARLEKPLTRHDAKRTCSDLARRVDARSVDELRLLSRWTAPATLGVSELTDDERIQLARTQAWPAYHDRALLYDLNLGADVSPTRFALFWGRQDCRSARMFNLDRFLTSDGIDDGRMQSGRIDAETEWALSTAEDRLILHEGRYFVFAGSPRGSKSIVSWVRPDGTIQPICMLQTAARSLSLLDGQDQSVCEQARNGKLTPVEWRKEQPDPDDCCPRALSNEYDGDDPITAFSAPLGLDAQRRQQLLVRVAYGPGRECGSVRTASMVLHEDLREPADTQLLDLLRESGGIWPEAYQLRNRYLVQVAKPDGTYHLLETNVGRVRQVCQFARKTKTSIEWLLDVEASAPDNN